MYDTSNRFSIAFTNKSQGFRTALDSRYAEVKVRAAPDWIDLGETMQSALEAYPILEE
jgi:hypothetical protein